MTRRWKQVLCLLFALPGLSLAETGRCPAVWKPLITTSALYLTMKRRWKQVLCLLFALLGLSLAERGRCPAGTFLAKNGSCIDCSFGTFTTGSNSLDACLPCHVCESGQIVVSTCTRTQDTVCGCKVGECFDEDFPERCVPCKSSNKQSNGTQNIWIAVGITFGVCVLLVVLVSLALCVICHDKSNKSQAFPDSLRNIWYSFLAKCIRHPQTASETQQNDLNERENLTEVGNDDESEGQDGCLQDIVDWEQQLESQAQAPRTVGTVQAQGDTKQVPTGTGQSQERRKRLVPVEGTNGAESLRLFFNDIPSIVSIHCWKPVMRRLGLTENEISAAEWECPKIHEQMYKMLMIWQEKQGMEASVNTLLDALEAQGQRGTKEIIQGRLVNSGKFIYEDDGGGSVVSHEEETMKLEDLPLLP